MRQLPRDILDYRVQVPNDIVVRVPNDAQSECLERAAPRSIVLSAVVVAHSIDLDHEASFGTIEIDDIAIDWRLTSKLPATQLLASQATPEQTFRIG